MDRYVIFADGTEMDVSMCGETDGVLWIKFKTDMTFVEMVKVLEEPERTKTITCRHHDREDGEREFEGYTSLGLVQRIEGGYNTALLKE